MDIQGPVRQQTAATVDYNAYTTEVEDSLVLAHNWGELLSAAPLALRFVGECMFVAASPMAASIMMDPPEGGFQYLKWKSLQANLVALTDEGRMAFITAQKNMEYIAKISSQICSYGGEVQDIMQALQTRRNTREALPEAMNQLKLSVNECKESIKEVEDKFDHWIKIAMELSQAATQSSSNAHGEFMDTEQQLATEEINEQAKIEEKAELEKAVQEAERQMTHAEKQLELATKAIPSGWDMIMKSFVENISSSISTAASLILGGGMPQQMHRDTGHTRSTTTLDEPDVPNDTSMMQLGQFEICVGLLTRMMNKPGQEPDWNNIYETHNDKPGTVTYLRGLLDSILDSLDRVESSESCTDKLADTVRDSIEVLDELNQATKDRQSLGADFQPGKRIKKLHERVAKIQRAMGKLKSGSLSRPTFRPSPRLRQEPKQNAASGSIAQVEMQNAASRFEIAQSCLESQRKLYNQRTTDLAAQHGKMLEIKIKIQRLNAHRLELSDIIVILSASIKALSGFKAKISKLVIYFGTVSNLINAEAGRHTDKLLRTLEQEMKSISIDGPSNQSTGMILSDFRREIVMKNACMIRANFMVIKETANLYTQVSEKHILPGVDLVERLGFAYESGSTQERTMASRMAELDKYQDEALKSIRKVANSKKELVLKRIDARQKAIQETLDMLPPAQDAEMIRKAVEEGTSATMDQYSRDSAYVDDVLKETESIVFDDGDELSI